MSGICDTCKRDECRMRMDGLKFCDMRKSESVYEKLFGTPEKAAKTFALHYFGSSDDACVHCVFFKMCDEMMCHGGSIVAVERQMLEWLRGEA